MTFTRTAKITFLGYFLQDNYMKEDFQSYPEIIFIDATYKLTELRLPVYIFLVEDSMGESEIAGVGLLMSENAESLRWLLRAFKGNNVNDQPRVIIADKDFNERHILKECFPTASILICLFHTLICHFQT